MKRPKSTEHRFVSQYVQTPPVCPWHSAPSPFFPTEDVKLLTASSQKYRAIYKKKGFPQIVALLGCRISAYSEPVFTVVDVADVGSV